ncbi:MAG: 2-C-methyl-D-erythritol 4-phosphate cytidylyltransferase [Bacteroidales bacterium]|nr:2-C-methyl-D-erythritol 4-phosphate cytidylyltransferase [Bacteroidales bacterium]
MKRYAIIVAGGIGKRMGTDVPKQFLPLGHKPVLIHTLDTFYRFDSQITVFLVLPEAYFDDWNVLAEQYRFSRFPVLVGGGESRFLSVKNALDIILDDNGVVLVHDGVRPLVSMQLIKTIFEATETDKAVIPVLSLTSSIREKMDNDIVRYADRNRFVAVQTPQGFNVNVLKEAYTQPFSEAFTDDASVVEKMGVDIRFVQGEQRNIKITTQADMELAEFYLSKIKKS